MQIVNHYSFAILVAIMIGLVATHTIRHKNRGDDLIVLGALILGFVFAFWLLSPPTASELDRDQLAEIVNQGKPVLVEFQSPYCLACMTSKMLVNQIAITHGNDLLIVHVNIQNQALSRAYAIEFTPTFLFFSTEGELLDTQTGIIDPQRIDDLMGSE